MVQDGRVVFANAADRHRLTKEAAGHACQGQEVDQSNRIRGLRPPAACFQ